MPNNAASFVAAQVIRLLPRTTISNAVGRLCDKNLPAPVSQAVVAAYARAFRVNLSEAECPTRTYDSFDEFFTRRLTNGARSFPQDPREIASPSDGRFQCSGPVEKGCRIVVKNRPYDVARLIGSEDEARAYLGGQFAVIYLSPRDYHRVHAPIDGTVTEVRSLGGDLYPVNAIGERWVRDLFVANKRVAIVIDSPTCGRITLVMVGAMIVGRITVEGMDAPDVPVGTHQQCREVRRGDEIGAFHLGSTVVLFAGAQTPTWNRQPGPIRLGDSLVRSG